MLKILRGDGLGARALRASAFTVFQTGAGTFLRLLSNLILTRLLFPEAFGLMGLVMIFVMGLGMFSDIGLRDAIIRQTPGDRVALNTLWTMQVIRGLILWVIACAIAWPVSVIYNEPLLQMMLPVVAITVVINGFQSTKEPCAIRDLQIGQLTWLTLLAQLIGLVIMALLAWWLQSVWALVFGTVISALLKVLFIQFGLPGPHDRFGWNWPVVRSTLSFGIFIFFSTIATFLVTNGSQMILGAYVSLAVFGIISISNNLAILPRMVSNTLAMNVLMPLYRMKPPVEDIENQPKIFKARRLVGLLSVGITACLALIGDYLVELLYDPRYYLAGPILVLTALCSMPIFAFWGIQKALIAYGDSRSHLIVTALTATIQLTVLFFLLPVASVGAAALAPMIAALITYPLLAFYTARYKTWDAKGDIGLILLAFLLIGLIGWLKADAIVQVFEIPLSVD
ncbi:MAG: oligosaccharide flippase family protein [Dinoroseobacter sp.]|nr:oligosaccharide flippase family protein [Dinoroseobacter sp.]